MSGRAIAVSCPRCGRRLESASVAVCPGCDASFTSLGGVPILIPDADPDTVDLRAAGGPLPTYDCSALGIPAIDVALASGEPVLELGAGLETSTIPSLVATDAFVYGTGRLDLVADAHALPFPDASFEFVFSLAVFEHLHSPWLAAREIARVLRPGGRVFTLCAFFQPLHGYPDHYFNATESGLRRLFDEDFELERCGPSRFCPHVESAVPLYRMHAMADAFCAAGKGDLHARLRARRLRRSLAVAAHQFQRLADPMLEVPAAQAAWRQIAPSVELLARRS